MSMKLYHYWRSSCSWRVRWALNLKGLPFESVPVNLLKGEQLDPAYKKLNPSGQVPCLIVDGKPLIESLAIIEWLEETHPEPRLLPKDPWARAEVRSMVMLIAAGIQPLANLKVQKYYSDDAEKKATWSRHFVEEGLAAVESLIEKRVLAGQGSSTFIFGEEPGMADIFLIPQVYNALRVEVDMNKFPNCRRIYDNALKTKACDQAAPHNQEGAQ